MGWRRRGVGAVVAVAVVVGTQAAVGAPPPPPLAGTVDRAEADRLEASIDWHIWNRQVYEIEYASTRRDANEVLDGAYAGERYPGIHRITDTTDSGLWTGTYVASQAFRYQVAKHYLHKNRAKSLPPEELAYWRDQKQSAIARVKPFLEQYHVNANISQEWKADPTDVGEPKPGSPIFDTGITPFPGGEPGLLFRACIPADAPARLSFPKKADGTWAKDTVYGPFHWAPENRDYYCEDGTSRDTYAGVTFGMVTAFDLFDEADLGPSATQPGVSLRTQAGRDLMLLTDFLVRHGWSTPRPHSKISTANDLSSFWSPLFLYTPGARVHMAAIARHVAEQIGTDEERTKFGAVWQAELTSSDPFEAFASELDAENKYNDYYKWNLGHLIAFDVNRIAANDDERAQLRTGIGVMDATTKWDQNAHFDAVIYSITGDKARLDRSVDLLRQWRTYRARYENPDTWFQYNHVRCGIDITCVQSGHRRAVTDTVLGPHVVEYDVPTEDGATEPDCDVYYPRNCRALDPLAVKDRTPTDFLWQRSPAHLDGDNKSPRHEAQGIDYLLPYWMLRYLTEVDKPAVASFPPFAGPYFK